ncbi:phage tail protein I [Caloramator sp. CAR-1]|uniref:phage tail protein I n=1 Tax=Caloramator sp. CAR-1 TaxID=3062777 RepID=UPI0026E2BA6A|nr:phage tail protein I [Caloramator sp. CAR-1]MDO6355270.1 phage tail protein I [Caloramator sp. CAR-1]
MNDIYNISILDILPSNLKTDPKIVAAAKAIDIELQKTSDQIKEAILLARIDELSEEKLDLLAWQFHVDYYDKQLDIERKRTMIKKSIEWHIKKGAVSSVEELIATTFGDKAEISEWFQYNGQPYTFKVTITNLVVYDNLVRKFLKALYSIKNVRSHLEALNIEMELSKPTDFIPIIEAINLAEQSYPDIEYKIIGAINNKVNLQCENKTYKFSYLLCNMPLCGTKPDLAKIGRTIQSILQMPTTAANYYFNYELCGTKYGISTIGLTHIDNLKFDMDSNVYSFTYELCGTKYCQA